MQFYSNKDYIYYYKVYWKFLLQQRIFFHIKQEKINLLKEKKFLNYKWNFQIIWQAKNISMMQDSTGDVTNSGLANYSIFGWITKTAFKIK